MIAKVWPTRFQMKIIKQNVQSDRLGCSHFGPLEVRFFLHHHLTVAFQFRNFNSNRTQFGLLVEQWSRLPDHSDLWVYCGVSTTKCSGLCFCVKMFGVQFPLHTHTQSHTCLGGRLIAHKAWEMADMDNWREAETGIEPPFQNVLMQCTRKAQEGTGGCWNGRWCGKGENFPSWWVGTNHRKNMNQIQQ